jgi:hypothetical protein
MRVPDFLVRQFYVAGSLQHEGDGFRLEARNGIGDGTLVGIRRLSVDGQAIDLASITATRAGDERVFRASEVSHRQPVSFRRDDVVTFHVAGFPLASGEHQFEVEIIELDAGMLTLSLRDTVRDGA